MRLKSNKNGNFFDTVIQYIVVEFIIVIAIIVSYVGYVFIDNMFISRAAEKTKNMEQLKVSISEYSAKIKEYQNLWGQMLATGDDKRVVSGLTFNKIETIFKTLAQKFDITNFTVSLDTTDSIAMIHSIKIKDLPQGVHLKVYNFKIVGNFEVETDVYNMIAFLYKNLPGVVIVNNIGIDAKFNPNYINDMLNVKSLDVKISGDWFFLTND
jgi:hypothetical protein